MAGSFGDAAKGASARRQIGCLSVGRQPVRIQRRKGRQGVAGGARTNGFASYSKRTMGSEASCRSGVCGIAGILSKNERHSPFQLLGLARSMAETMRHRGPDDAGVWVSADGRIALAHRRLSIIDTSPGGHQPMEDTIANACIVFNGEIYNFLELKDELERSGLAFRSHSDTEVLLGALRHWGLGALPRLDAMFAFGYYSAAERSLLLARDIFGEKPLYYVDTSEYFAFASELHALTLLPGFDATVDRDVIAAYLCFQYVPGTGTIYRRSRKLAPGHWLCVDERNNVRMEPYFTFETSVHQGRRRPLDDLADELEERLVVSVKRRLISDVPLGAFLSGGVDSSTVAAVCTRKLGRELKTYSIGFENHRESEHFDAAEVARHLGTDHRDRVLAADALALGAQIGGALDEPNADTSCLPTYLLCKFAREEVTVALSGDGGDELFGGYARYFNTVSEWERKRAGDRSLDWWRAGEVYLSSRILVFPDDELISLFGSVPRPLRDLLSRSRAAIECDGRPLLNVLRELDARTYLPGAVLAKVDRMSMQHSLEVRAPLLGMDVARFAMALAADECYEAGEGKMVLKRVASRYLPPGWVARPKRGFGLPMDMWGAAQLMPALKQVILSKECRLAEFVDRSSLRQYIARLEREFHAYRGWALFILENWLRAHPATPAE